MDACLEGFEFASCGSCRWLSRRGSRAVKSGDGRNSDPTSILKVHARVIHLRDKTNTLHSNNGQRLYNSDLARATLEHHARRLPARR